jgi:hypothetical protein
MPTIGGGDDFVWIGGPDEGLWLLVDGGLEIDDAFEDAAFEAPLGEDGEETLDGVEPTGRGGLAPTGGQVAVCPNKSSLLGAACAMSACPLIVLQKSKVAGPRIFRENTKRKAIADSYNLNRIAEVACEFNVRR